MDKDGAQLVPTYRGVWVNTLGKYFAKLSGSAIKDNDDRIIEFVSADDAALFYDSKAAQTEGAELNFKKDATRIVYPDTSSMANASRGLDALGGGASSVVPALSIINLKVSYLLLFIACIKRNISYTCWYWSHFRIYPKMSSLFFVIRGKLQGRVPTRNAMFTSTAVFVVKHEKDTIGGKARSRSMVQIIILEHTTLNGTRQLSMVSLILMLVSIH